MGLSDLLTSVAVKYRLRQKEKVDLFVDMTRKVADGDVLKEGDILTQLDRFGRSPEELQTAVEKLLARRRAAAAVKAGESVEAQRAEVNRKSEACTANYTVAVQTAEQKYMTALQPLRAKLADLDRVEKEARAGESLLKDTWENPELLAEVADLAKEMQTLRNRQGELLTRAKAEERESDRTAAALKTATTGLESRLLPASMEARAEELQAKLKASTEAEKALRGEAAAVEERVAEIVGRLGEIEASKLIP